ncbi:MAG: hypothetical protein EP330_19325 [Deltaproteobacteria bacterium]|nr:MAG: hypothetical protein EP330_19325 [Deltaproteobacteria bacterium]
MDKGTRVRIIGGRNGKGKTGEIFWKGPNKWGEGERFGVRGDDGQTYWVAEKDCEKASGPAPEPEAGDTFEKGDRVRFQWRGREGTGTVFWIGESRNGPGQRLGVRDDAPEGEEDAVWLDARFCKALGEEEDGHAPAPRQERQAASDYDDEIPAAQSYEMPPLDDGPPLDDAYVDSWASAVDDEDEPPFDL